MSRFASGNSARLLCALVIACSLPQGGALAQSRLPLPLPEESFASAREGRVIYARICAGCHLSNGKGAVGAGRYPALAGNSKLEHSQYSIEIVLEGRGAMPPFKGFLDDEQVAAVLNYARGPEFEHNYAASITAAEVHRSRH